jgi:hypothetical protein
VKIGINLSPDCIEKCIKLFVFTPYSNWTHADKQFIALLESNKLLISKEYWDIDWKADTKTYSNNG